MAPYAADVESNARVYDGKRAGSTFLVQIRDVATKALVADGVTQWSADDAFEVLQVEETGEDGINETVDGRHNGQGSFSGNFTAHRQDLLPSRSDNVREFTITVKPRPDQADAGIPQIVLVGVHFTSINVQGAARGLVTLTGAFTYQRKYTGVKFAVQSGTY